MGLVHRRCDLARLRRTRRCLRLGLLGRRLLCFRLLDLRFRRLDLFLTRGGGRFLFFLLLFLVRRLFFPLLGLLLLPEPEGHRAHTWVAHNNGCDLEIHGQTAVGAFFDTCRRFRFLSSTFILRGGREPGTHSRRGPRRCPCWSRTVSRGCFSIRAGRRLSRSLRRGIQRVCPLPRGHMRPWRVCRCSRGSPVLPAPRSPSRPGCLSQRPEIPASHGRMRGPWAYRPPGG